MEGLLLLDGAIGGLAFRLDDVGGGYFVELVAGSAEVTLKKWLPGRVDADSRPWFQYAELQRGRTRNPVRSGEARRFQLIVNGPYVEFSFDDEVVLATVTAERTTSSIGIWAESGGIQARDATVSTLRRPVNRL